MVITFCGHSTVHDTSDIQDKLCTLLQSTLKNDNAIFYLGGYGDFDAIAKKCCTTFKSTHPDAKLYFVTPYLDASYLDARNVDGYDGIIYPPLETVPKRLAIAARNKWMIQQSDAVIAYVDHSWGGAAKSLEYAHKLRKPYFNLGKYKFE